MSGKAKEKTGAVHLTIDGVAVDAAKGTTILRAARSVGIEVPTLCHDDELSHSGNCRVCVVEVEGSRTLLGACHTPVAAGMVVHTKSHRVRKARRAIIELMLAGHTGPCVTDEAAAACRLHALASELQAGPPRFSVGRPRSHPKEAGRYVVRDLSKCVLCRRCVRACEEVAGESVYAVAYRGSSSKVVVDCDVPLDKAVCKECGACVDYCPTSALKRPEGRKAESGKGKTPRPGRAAGRTDLLPLLKEAQGTEKGLSGRAIAEVAGRLGIPAGEAFGVASFYAFLSTKPQGRHVVRVCKSLPCHMKEGQRIVDAIEAALGIEAGGTTEDGAFSFMLANCIGACDRAPAMLVDDTVYGDLTPDGVAGILGRYRGA